MATAELYDIGCFDRLPFEIIQEIYHYCKSSLFWRIAALIDLAKRNRALREEVKGQEDPQAHHASAKTRTYELSSSDETPITLSPPPSTFYRFRVCEISSWCRDGEFVLSPQQGHGIIRITVDARGIKEFERLGCTRQKRSWDKTDQFAYVEQPVEDFEGMLLEAKVPL